MRFAGEDLGVARVGEPHPVREFDGAAECAVAGDRSVLDHQRFPEERHQPRASSLRRRRPEPAIHLGRFRVASVEGRPQDVHVQTAEDLLGSRAVQRDEDHVVDGRLGMRHGSMQRAEQREEDQACAHPRVLP
ncbi:MAG TPA: hypothetical protein DCP38_07975 [Acidobacteria bacterium]|nr:hypothetical protein [Acidobacteriota bacterium]